MANMIVTSILSSKLDSKFVYFQLTRSRDVIKCRKQYPMIPMVLIGIVETACEISKTPIRSPLPKTRHASALRSGIDGVVVGKPHFLVGQP